MQTTAGPKGNEFREGTIGLGLSSHLPFKPLQVPELDELGLPI